MGETTKQLKTGEADVDVFVGDVYWLVELRGASWSIVEHRPVLINSLHGETTNLSNLSIL